MGDGPVNAGVLIDPSHSATLGSHDRAGTKSVSRAIVLLSFLEGFGKFALRWRIADILTRTSIDQLR